MYNVVCDIIEVLAIINTKNMKITINTLAGISWVLVTVYPTQVIGVAVILTLGALELIVNGDKY